jgi:hypothetical protein
MRTSRVFFLVTLLLFVLICGRTPIVDRRVTAIDHDGNLVYVALRGHNIQFPRPLVF